MRRLIFPILALAVLVIASLYYRDATSKVVSVDQQATDEVSIPKEDVVGCCGFAENNTQKTCSVLGAYDCSHCFDYCK